MSSIICHIESPIDSLHWSLNVGLKADTNLIFYWFTSFSFKSGQSTYILCTYIYLYVSIHTYLQLYTIHYHMTVSQSHAQLDVLSRENSSVIVATVRAFVVGVNASVGCEFHSEARRILKLHNVCVR